jgi:SET and MYND domain-containing protein
MRLYQQALAVADGAAPSCAATGVQQQRAPAAAARAADNSSSRGWRLRLRLGQHHVLRMRAAAGLLKAAVDAADWQVAPQAARDLTPTYELVYPQVWPNLGLHYATLAKLEVLLEHPAAAAAAAEAAAGILRATHDGSSSVMREVLQTRYEAGQELAAAAAAGN